MIFKSTVQQTNNVIFLCINCTFLNDRPKYLVRTNTRVFLSECRTRADFVLVLDSSGSVGANNYNKMREFSQLLVSDLDIDEGQIRFGLMTFSTSAEVRFHLNKWEIVTNISINGYWFIAISTHSIKSIPCYNLSGTILVYRYDNRGDIQTEIESADYSRGTTNTAQALQTLYTSMFTSQNGDRADAHNIVMIITDGASNENRRTLDVRLQTVTINYTICSLCHVLGLV